MSYPMSYLRVCLWLSLACSNPFASAEKLLSPWDATHTVQTDEPHACPAAPAFAKTLEIGSYYIDSHASVADAKKLAQFQKDSAAPTLLMQMAAQAADAYLAHGSKDAARCVYRLLDAAALADAWDGRMPNFQGVYVQGWLLSGVGIAYLKVRPSGLGAAEQTSHIQRWLGRLSLQVRAYYDSHMEERGSDAWNNHLNWAGLAVAAEAAANDDAGAADWALKAYERGISLIQPDGSLPAEMARAGMALHYHLYALGPLVLLAEFIAANGGDGYADQSGAIHRLVKFCVAGLRDPAFLEKRTGVPQVVSKPLSGTDIGWAVPYLRHFPEPGLRSLLATAAWTNASSWGGAPPE